MAHSDKPDDGRCQVHRTDTGGDDGNPSRNDSNGGERLDSIFELLSNRVRRYALYYLYQQGNETAGITELVQFIAAETSETDHLDAESVYIRLRHNHLQKMDEYGVIEYDHPTGSVRYDGTPILERCLEHALQYEQ
jgi:hypothetical protein